MEPRIECIRCRRELGKIESAEGWNVIVEQGHSVGYVCPGCQTPEENAEAVIHESTLEHGVDDRDRRVTHTKADDSCIVCGRSTDTGLGFVGETEWVVAGLVKLGVSEERAFTLVSQMMGNPPWMVPDGEVSLAFRVCADCAGKVDLVVGPLSSTDSFPGYRQKG
jgi:hypothetical protein